MGCGVLKFGEGEIGPYGRRFEDMEGMKVDLFVIICRRKRDGGKINLKSFYIRRLRGRGNKEKQTLPLQVYIAKTSERET